MMKKNLNRDIYLTILMIVFVVVGLILIIIGNVNIWGDDAFMAEWKRVQFENWKLSLPGILLVTLSYVFLIGKSKK